MGCCRPPCAPRGEYRVYEQRHMDALHAFLLLVRAVRYRLAKPIMMAITKGDIDDALTHLDAAHASLTQDREALGRLEKVLASAEADRPAEATTDPLTIGELARKLGVTPTTLRSWEKAGALTPRRHPTGSREYQPKDVRDAHLVHMLRRGHVPAPAHRDCTGADPPQRQPGRGPCASPRLECAGQPPVSTSSRRFSPDRSSRCPRGYCNPRARQCLS